MVLTVFFVMVPLRVGGGHAAGHTDRSTGRHGPGVGAGGPSCTGGRRVPQEEEADHDHGHGLPRPSGPGAGDGSRAAYVCNCVGVPAQRIMAPAIPVLTY